MIDLATTAVSSLVRVRLLVAGVVQGVGFRPFVYGLARAYGLTGFVGNDSRGVFVEVEGEETAVAAFCQQLELEPPPLARIESVASERVPLAHSQTFAIVPSQSGAAAGALVPADVAICPACQQELLDPHDRRYGYPFINCTHCGPRFTIIKAMPYDRPLTTMAAFTMCANCQAEYENPLDRRFHAQPNSCPLCGPRVWLEMAGEPALPNPPEPILAVQRLLRQGHIVAIKGVGGFHLACGADDEAAVARLRQRKGRVDKPFAVMAKDLATVRQLAHVSAAEERVLLSPERPIVLLRSKKSQLLSPLLAPGQATIGVMLPYTPLHLLLFHPFAEPPKPVLLMTSANRRSEPIVTGNEEARQRLAGLADAFLLHDRVIYGRCDDSVLRVVGETVLPLRRSRGYVPFPVKLPFAVPPILAVGGEMKAAFCLTQGRDAYLSQHIGDMENVETVLAMETAVNQFQTLFRIQPERLACDQHPLYLSKQWAEQQGLPVVAVQHHHAHIAAVMAEHQLPGDRPVLGFSFDGTGYGTDGAVWGGELLLANYVRFDRVAHLGYVPLAGGDAAVKRPYRLALAYLWAAGLPWDEDLPAVQACPPAERQILRQQLARKLNVVPSSSMGRLFDGVASLCGVRQVVNYEGQAAMELEAVAAEGVTNGYGFEVSPEGVVVEVKPVIEGVVADVRAGIAPAIVSAKFHQAVVNLMVQLGVQWRARTGVNQVVLSGGVFQNVRLLKTAVCALSQHQFEVLTHRLVPPNDGGLALGQAIIASQQK